MAQEELNHFDKEEFSRLTQSLFEHCGEGEFLSVDLVGEHTRFCRFNKGRVRQDGYVNDFHLEVKLFISKNGQSVRHGSTGFSLSHNQNRDREQALLELKNLRQRVVDFPVDPYARVPKFDHQTEQVHRGQMLPEKGP